MTLTDSRFTAREVTNVGPVAGVADHNVAEWGLWINRPLLSQWAWDLIRWLDFLDEQSRNREDRAARTWMPSRPYVLVALEEMCLPAILAGGLDPRVAGVSCDRCLVSYVGREARPWSGIPMGLLAPNILDLVDVSQLAALLAPRPFVLASALEPDGEPAAAGRMAAAFEFARRIYDLLGASACLKLGEPADLRTLLGNV